MASKRQLFALLLALLVRNAEFSKIGLCYGRVGANVPQPEIAARLLQSHNISKARLFNPDPSALLAFRSTGIDLMVGVPNEDLPALAAGSPEFAAEWLQSRVFAYVSPAQIRYLAVGNEVLYKDPFYTPHLLPAIHNLHTALQNLHLADAIKLSTAHASTILTTSYPPSASAFDPSVLPTILPLLRFLLDTNAPLMVNIYPYFAYANDPSNVPLAYAISASGAPTLHDQGAVYDNMFDAMVDAFATAMQKAGFGEVGLAVTETGWPTSGGVGAGVENAAEYNGGVVRGVGTGTPRGVEVVELFLFGLYDEEGKEGEEFERHFGIFKDNGEKFYHIGF